MSPPAGLTRLRQISNHPGLLREAYRSVQGISGKFELFDELLQTLLANGHKVLVFSQFTRMLAILSRRLQARKRLTFVRVINRAGSPGDRSISTEDLKALLDVDPA